MSRNIVLELFLIASVALFWIQRALAYTQYLDAYNSTLAQMLAAHHLPC